MKSAMPKATAAWLVALSLLPLGCSRDKSAQPSAQASAAPRAALAGSAHPLAAGTPAPDVTFALASGEKLTLSSLRGKPVVVYFYPKDDTPGRTIYRSARDPRPVPAKKICKKSGAVVVGVSVDPADSHRAFAEKHALPFMLASDENGEVAKAFGVALKNELPRHARELRDWCGRSHQAHLSAGHTQRARGRAFGGDLELTRCRPETSIPMTWFCPWIGVNWARSDEPRTLGLGDAPGVFSRRRARRHAHARLRNGARDGPDEWR